MDRPLAIRDGHGWTAVAQSDEIAERGRLILNVGGRAIGIFRLGGGLFAYLNRCAHMGGPVCQGLIVPRVIELLSDDRSIQGSCFDENDLHIACPWHGTEYSIRTGAHAGDGRMKLTRVEVSEERGQVYVRI